MALTAASFLCRSKRKSHTSQFRGVKKSGNRWESQVVRVGVCKRVGVFDSEQSAARAYDDAAREIFGVAASLNFPTQLDITLRRRERFHCYVRLTDFHPDDCWDWIGPVRINRKYPNHSYGYATDEVEDTILAHRLSYILYIGPIPEGLYVCHKCDRPLCVNPNHLFLGTHEDNMRDCIAKGRQRGAVGERNSHAKLSKESVSEIRRIFNGRRAYLPGGKAFKLELAEKYGVSWGTIYHVASGATWKE